jgi:hypothetical protein
MTRLRRNLQDLHTVLRLIHDKDITGTSTVYSDGVREFHITMPFLVGDVFKDYILGFIDQKFKDCTFTYEHRNLYSDGLLLTIFSTEIGQRVHVRRTWSLGLFVTLLNNTVQSFKI